jgi:hypothetical protein
MYEEKMEAIQPKQAEHISIAEQMAKEIAINFNPDQQNDMLRCIRNVVSERRQSEIEETEKQLAYLKDTLQKL